MATLDYINKNLLERALYNFFKDEDVIVLDFQIENAVSTGENYIGGIYRVKITYRLRGTKRTSALIVKMEPKDNIMADLCKITNFFGKESFMYEKILPKANKLLNGSLEKTNATISCKWLLTVHDTVTSILLEDLKEKGYQMLKRQKGLDFEHCKMVIKKIATFHAATHIMTNKEPELTKLYSKSLFEDNLSDWIMAGYRSLMKYSAEWTDMKEIHQKLKRYDEDFLSKSKEASCFISDDFNALTHGDLWVNNLLFRYNTDGSVQDVKFIDFQVSKYTNPVIDLHYFLCTSPTNDIRCEKFDTLLDIYFSQLLLTLAELGYDLAKAPTRVSFRKSFKDRAFYAITTSATVMAMIISEKHPDANFEKLMTEDGVGSFRHHSYTDKNFVQATKSVLNYYDKLGVLD